MVEVTVLARNQQEKLVHKIEEKLYKVLLLAVKEHHGCRRNRRDLRHIFNWINFAIAYYYLDNDLRDYLLDIKDFLCRYKAGKNTLLLKNLVQRKS